MSDSQQIIQRRTVEQLVTAWELSVKDIRAGFALIAGAEARLDEAFTSNDHTRFDVRDRWNRHCLDFGDPEEAIVSLEQQVWSTLLDRLELWRMMSVERAEKVRKQLEYHAKPTRHRPEGYEPFPPITVENVWGFVQGMYGALPDMLTEAINEVFEWLRPHRNAHSRTGSPVGTLKTNSELEIGRKVVLGYVCENGWNNKFRVNYNRSKELQALDNVFRALDGKGSIAHTETLADAINTTPLAEGRGETPYFRFRLFKNGNMHLEFRRLDLLKRFNQGAGGKRLRPSTEAA